MRSTKTIKMAQMAILIAIVLIMAFTPLGYLKTAGLEISLITIPVAIGAMVIGPGAGAVLGAVFGFTSFYQCFGMSQFVGGLITAVLNTVFFVGLLILFFWNTDYIQSLNAAGANAFLFFIAFVGINGVVEWIATTVAGGVIAKAVAKIAKNA